MQQIFFLCTIKNEQFLFYICGKNGVGNNQIIKILQLKFDLLDRREKVKITTLLKTLLIKQLKLQYTQF